MRIAIATNFQDLNCGYSLVSVVLDQIAMLYRYGHDVHLYVNERYNPAYEEEVAHYVHACTIHKTVPFGHLHDYQKVAEMSAESQEYSRRIFEFMCQEFPQYDAVFTHDWIFTGWNLPFALAIRAMAHTNVQQPQWFHWIHSVPSRVEGTKDWWEIDTFGPGHFIVFPNNCDRVRVAESFHANLAQVYRIPHARDLRNLADFCADSMRFIDAFPGVMQADVVQVYPASVDRLSAKQLEKVIHIFAAFKRRSLTGCLVVVDQWATTLQRKEDVERYKMLASGLGLVTEGPGTEVVFTSDFEPPNFERGVSRKMLYDLMQCSNLFVFPTMEESWGLVSVEAALAGAFIVTNKSLEVSQEQFAHQALSFHFSSRFHTFDAKVAIPDKPGVEVDHWFEYLDQVASLILSRMARNEAVMTKAFVRRLYNWDTVYQRHYEPMLAEVTRAHLSAVLP
jgi:glycosyltransferase involved in cell wall biosynthesis